MAEIISNDHNNKKKRRRSIKVDLTPMVDLGFLLITFFVFTTAMTESKAMNIIVPDDKDSSMTEPVCESCALTVIAGKENTIFYYEGVDKEAMYKKTSYTANGLRKLIIKKKKQVMDLMHKDRFVLIIKPSSGSNFKNLVDIIDETSICNVKRYYITELNESDRKIVQ